MKFGKHLRLMSVAAWATDYIDYAGLKKRLHAASVSATQSAAAATAGTTPGSGASTPIARRGDSDSEHSTGHAGMCSDDDASSPARRRGTSSPLSQSDFITLVESEISRAAAAMSRQTGVAQAMVSDAVTAVQAANGPPADSLHLPSPIIHASSSRGSETGSPPHADGPRWDAAAAIHAAAGVHDFALNPASADAAVSHADAAAAVAAPPSLRVAAKEMETATPLTPAVLMPDLCAAAHASILRVSVHLDDVRSFATLNCTAVDKICKKYDKKFSPGTPTLALLQDTLTASALADTATAALLAALAADCVKLTQSLPPPVTRPPKRSVVMQPSVATVSSLDVASLPAGSVTCLRLSMGVDAVSAPVSVPVMVAKGSHAGPTLGITSAVHGNELNGIPIIHRLFNELDCTALCGVVIALPVVNVHGYARYTRGFSDGADLNRIMPGKKEGTASQQFAYQFVHRVLKHMDVLLDLHTASFGRVNSLYVRADMTHPDAFRLARLQNPQIIVHNTGPDGSLRSAAATLGKAAITVEIGNPQSFHRQFIDTAFTGVLNTLAHFKMVARDVVLPPKDAIVCARSSWIFTSTGGVLYVYPAVSAWVRKGDTIAEVYSIFGALEDRILAPTDGVVIGKSTNPVCQTGDRVVHLGVVDDHFATRAEDGHT